MSNAELSLQLTSMNKSWQHNKKITLLSFLHTWTYLPPCLLQSSISVCHLTLSKQKDINLTVHPQNPPFYSFFPLPMVPTISCLLSTNFLKIYTLSGNQWAESHRQSRDVRLTHCWIQSSHQICWKIEKNVIKLASSLSAQELLHVEVPALNSEKFNVETSCKLTSLN